MIFVKKKIKGLYLPFLKWCVCFLLLHNVFMIIGVYNQTYGYLGGSSYYTINDYLQKLFYIVFTMHDYEYLLGGFWFIRSLVVAILLISIFSFFIRKEFMYKYILFCVFFLGVTIIIRKYCPKTELARDVSLGALGASFYCIISCLLILEESSC